MKLRHGELILASAGNEDLPELEQLYGEFCGGHISGASYELCSPGEFLRGEKMPREGQPENFELLTVRINEMLIGGIMLYRDFPGKGYVEILSLYIGQPARCSGFGTKAAKMICRYFYESGYAAVRTAVPLQSWGGLRFWNRLGFDRIIALDAQGEASDEGVGVITLEKRF